jgi:hypothetical protein
MGVEIAAMAIAALVPELRSLVRWYLRVHRHRRRTADGAGHGSGHAAE